MERQLRVEATIERAVERQVRVGEDDVEAYYWAHLLEFYEPTRVRAEQILVETSAQAQALKQELEDGKDFAALAREFSRGPERDRGGDLGWVSKQDLPNAFTQVLFKLKAGEVSDPVETEYGYHLFRVAERNQGGKMSPEAAKAEIAEKMRREKIDRAFQAWLEDLRARSRIMIYNVRGAE